MRLILTLLLMTLTAPAWAEWVSYGATDTAVFYYDPATIKKKGHFRRVWGIRDFKQRNKRGELSSRNLREYDCKEDRVRILSLSAHSERMAGGKTLFSHTFSLSQPGGEWEYIAPKSVLAATREIVCK